LAKLKIREQSVPNFHIPMITMVAVIFLSTLLSNGDIEKEHQRIWV